jgi:tryptophanase
MLLREHTEIVATVKEIAWGLRGYRITYEPPLLRHFTARFEPLGQRSVLSA